MTTYVVKLDRLCNISTHTLTWSVTLSTAVYKHSDRISTHTLTWSVTLLLLVKAV